MILVVLLLILSLAPACSRVPESTAEAVAAPAPALTVEGGKVASRELQRTVSAIGTLDPNQEVIVTNQVEGLVSSLSVDLGDSVKQGQLLAQLDIRELELAVRQQTAALQEEMARLGVTDPGAGVDEASTSQVRQAEATFAEARIRLDRTKKLTDEGVLPKQQLDEQQARYDIAEAALKSSRESVRNIRATIAARKAALDLAEKKLSDARVVAPLAGFVKERSTSEGVYLRANSPVVTLVQANPLKLRVEVPETAIGAVQAGRIVQFTVDSLPDRTFEGRISRLSPSVDQQSRTLKLEALVDNGRGELKPGLFARVTILTGRQEKALVAPAEALFAVAGIEKVFLIQEGKVTERIVRSGTRGDGFVEILEGVQEGDLLATSNLGSLQQGREVNVR